MQIFVYEWATGGGLVEEPGTLPGSLVREGAAMVGALAADLVKISGCQVSALRDPRNLQFALPRCKVVDVISRFSHRDEFECLAAEADATILIAPEFDGILLAAARCVLDHGGRLLSPSAEFIGVTSDKQRTCESLAAAGVPVPQGTVIEPDGPLPEEFDYPAVLKPIDGAGSQDVYIVSGPHDSPPAYAWPRRLERYAPGLAASVSLLCGPHSRVALAPCRQRISDNGRLQYLGGELPLPAGLAERAAGLAERALAALPPTTGYVGVDLILGRDPHGSEDVVIEVNPRLTTSYVGLRAAARSNLAEAMWLVSQGQAPNVSFDTRPLEFD
ncbi:MAG TPA: ATP-grasp domain-containing protein, partial [Lacipirellulaceae bacterium]